MTTSRTAGTGIRFHGWRIVAMCAVTLGMTAPGQTVGVSVFIDPMIEALDLTRSQLSGAWSPSRSGSSASACSARAR